MQSLNIYHGGMLYRGAIQLRTKLHLLVGALLVAVQPALAEGFPGKGSNAAWSDALPYYNSGNKLLGQERYQEAAARFQTAISKYEFDPDFLQTSA